MLHQLLTEYYRCPEDLSGLTVADDLPADQGYFRFGRDNICFGRCRDGRASATPAEALYDALEDVSLETGVCRLGFDPAEVVENLRRERYIGFAGTSADPQPGSRAQKLARDAYYRMRPLLPVAVRRHLQKFRLRDWEQIGFPRWPVDGTVDRIIEAVLALSLRSRGVDRMPFIWFWPDGYKSCAIVTHDVEAPAGLEFCDQLMDMDYYARIGASFQIVPEVRYRDSAPVRARIRERGFEVNVHDLDHDGRLYEDREEFLLRAAKINRYAREFGARGFRSGALYRNTEWYEALEFSYDMSVPNVGHLEAQRGGCCTVMPYFIGEILELPLTTMQDYSLFQILGDYSIDIWKRQIGMIRERHGLASFIVHPDYVIEPRAQNTYWALLAHLCRLRAEGEVWIDLPGEVDRWWRQRRGMRLVSQDGNWTIEGEGRDRARVAWATLDGEGVRLSIEPAEALALAM